MPVQEEVTEHEITDLIARIEALEETCLEIQQTLSDINATIDALAEKIGA